MTHREVLMLPRVERLTQAFRHLSAASEPQTIADIACAIGMSTSNARRIIAELRALGWARRAPARRAKPGRGALPFRFIAVKPRITQ